MNNHTPLPPLPSRPNDIDRRSRGYFQKQTEYCREADLAAKYAHLERAGLAIACDAPFLPHLPRQYRYLEYIPLGYSVAIHAIADRYHFPPGSLAKVVKYDQWQFLCYLLLSHPAERTIEAPAVLVASAPS